MGLRASRQVKARDGRSKGAVGMSPPLRLEDFADLPAERGPVIHLRNVGVRGLLEKGGKGEEQGRARKLCRLGSLHHEILQPCMK